MTRCQSALDFQILSDFVFGLSTAVKATRSKRSLTPTMNQKQSLTPTKNKV
jgi:hypothetical protein